MEEKCMHEMIYVEDSEQGMRGYCPVCGMKINIFHIKQGLYAFEYESNYYLLNTLTDMDFKDNIYNFKLNNCTICLFKDHIYKEEEKVHVKKIDESNEI